MPTTVSSHPEHGGVPSGPAGASDGEVVHSILLHWQRAASASRHGPTHASVLQAAALAIFGDAAVCESTALKRRYRQLAIRAHPDKNASPQASEAFQVLQSCFEFASCHADGNQGGGGASWHTEPAPRAAPTAAASSPTSSTTFTSASTSTWRASSSSTSSSNSHNSHQRRESATNGAHPFAPAHTAHDARNRGTHAAAPPRPSPFTSPSRAPANPAAAPRVPAPPDVFGAATAGSSASVPTASRAPACGTPVPNVFFDDDADGVSAVPPPPPPVFESTDLRSTSASAAAAASLAGTYGAQAAHGHSQRARDSPPHLRSRVHGCGTPSTSRSSSVQSYTTADGIHGQPAPPRRSAAPQRKPHHSHLQRAPRAELPTLAELLARLDADDDSDEGGDGEVELEEDAVRWTAARGGPPVQHQLPTRTRAAAGAASTPHHVDAASHAGTLHSSGPARVATLLDTAGGGLRGGGLKEEVTRRGYAAPPNIFSASLSGRGGGAAVRSRRAGGGSASHATGSGQQGQVSEARCACGKALRGRCFICEE